jgi:putative endonuclease
VSYLVYIARGPRGALRIGRAGKTGDQPVGDQNGDASCRAADRPNRLVYYEFFQTVGDAIQRERQLKTWQRRWKVELVERVNPRWDDLSGSLLA